MMSKKMVVVFASVLVGSCFLSISFTAYKGMPLTENKEAESIPKKALLEDIDYFVEKIEIAHANPYRLVSREDFMNLVSHLKNYVRGQQQDRLSFMECFYVLQEMAAALQDEHTGIKFPFESLSQTELFFPFKIRVVGEKMFVGKSLGDTTIPEFSELLEINNVQTRSIWKKCLKYLNPPLPHAKVNMFEKYISTILTTLFDMHSPWLVRYRSGASVNSVKAEGVNGEMLFKALFESPAYRGYSTVFKGKEIPILYIPSFAYGRYQDYERFIDNFFSKHQNKKTLVIDLRGNPGGNGTWGYYMLDYLADTPYRIIDVFDFKVSEIFRTSGYRSKAGDRLAGAKNGDYIPSASDRMRTPQNKKNKFPGTAFLLVSHATDSAGVVTAAIFKHSKMGTVIGQETAGRIKFNSDPVTVKLPKSGLEAYIPVAIYALPGNNPDRGVIPDIVIDYSIEDLTKHLDKEMEKVKELIIKII